ncbi:MAG: translation initiation factor IF-2 [Pseudobdellovibrio sp.]
MSNPKVFEFAKDVGMTPLALMDKIKEWNFPVKNHMAEIEPDILEQIKIKLAGTDKGSDEKPKKTATRKPSAAAVAKKAASTSAAKPTNKISAHQDAEIEKARAAATAAAASSVIRRKTKEVEPIVDEGRAKIISKPEVAVVEEKMTTSLIEPEVTTVKKVIEPAIIEKVAPAAVTTAPVVTSAAVVAPVVAATTTTVAVAPVVVAPIERVAPPISRKKEVAIGDSGVSSSGSGTLPRRNIIGKMDLSRVQDPRGPARPLSGPRSQGYQGNNPNPAMGAGGFNARPSTGMAARPGTTTGARNIRTGFVAQAPELPVFTNNLTDTKRDYDKKAKKFGVATATGGLSAKEKEAAEIINSFNPNEFKKRELVFQPRKKMDILNRQAMKTQITQPKASKRVLKVNGKMKVSDVASEMGLKAAQLVKALMKNGVMATMNTDLDFDTISLIVTEFGWEAQNVFRTADEMVVEMAFGNLEADKITRPPVVTVMGHVDHGKTSLLDAIRNAKVVDGEAGGITQHIGAYSVKTEDGSLITFLDTPGHEAFTAMRARGANATDIAVIVVAADDGMMPQTAEAINHAKAAGVPIIVAVNKMDKPGANPERIKQQLTEFEIVPEEWGGTTIFCEVSALKRTGIDKLLENIKLLAEVAELKANPSRSGTGIVIEAKLEKGRGAVATILVKDGTVSIGQYIVAGSMKGKVKSLIDDKGQRVDKMTPGLPVEVLGLEGVPSAGDRFDVVADEKTAEQVVANRKQVTAAAASIKGKISMEDIFSKVTGGDVKDFNIVLKSDVHGSLEAIQGMLAKLTSAEVKNKVIHAAVGGITENDVLLAHTAKGIVIGFNVRPDNNAQAKAKQIGVDIRTYSIVYEMIDEVRKAMAGVLAPQIVEKVMGAAEVRNTFSVPKMGVIAGCFVTTGKIQRSNMLRLVRDGKIVFEGKVGSLRRFKDDAKEVVDGFECGIGIEGYSDIKVGDTIEAFIKEEVVRELTPLNP